MAVAASIDRLAELFPDADRTLLGDVLADAAGDFNAAAETMHLFEAPSTPTTIVSSPSFSSAAAAAAVSSSTSSSSSFSAPFSSASASSALSRQRPLPTRTPQTAFVPWLWAQCATDGRHDEPGDLAAATQEGRAYLARFSAERSSLNGDGDCGGATKRPRLAGTSETLTAHRARASRELHAIAAKHRVTCGKWCLFAPRATVDTVWAAIADSTEHGSLGHSSKVATDAGQERFLICVYTPDFQRVSEVGRILGELKRMSDNRALPGICLKSASFKSDFFTYIDVYSKNKWGIAPSLYVASMFPSGESLSDCDSSLVPSLQASSSDSGTATSLEEASHSDKMASNLLVKPSVSSLPMVSSSSSSWLSNAGGSNTIPDHEQCTDGSAALKVRPRIATWANGPPKI